MCLSIFSELSHGRSSGGVKIAAGADLLPVPDLPMPGLADLFNYFSTCSPLIGYATLLL